MIEKLDLQEHVVALRLSGDMTAEDVEKAYKITEDALKNNERISFYAEVDGSMNITFEGLVKDLLQLPGQLGKLSRYYRAAVVTDKGWIAAMARIEGIVFSSIDVRVYPTDESQKAKDWVAEEPEPLPKSEEPGISVNFIPTSSDHVFAYEVNGRLREADIKLAIKEFSPFLEREGDLNVIGKFQNFNGFDLTSVLDDDLIKLKYRSASRIKRYAVIGATPWMRNFLELIGSLLSTKVKLFDLTEEDAAWNWVGATRAAGTDEPPNGSEPSNVPADA